jgi:hypothetical protein
MMFEQDSLALRLHRWCYEQDVLTDVPAPRYIALLSRVRDSMQLKHIVELLYKFLPYKNFEDKINSLASIFY